MKINEGIVINKDQIDVTPNGVINIAGGKFKSYNIVGETLIDLPQSALANPSKDEFNNLIIQYNKLLKTLRGLGIVPR